MVFPGICLTVLGNTSGPLAITGSEVVPKGQCVGHCTCLYFYFVQRTGCYHVAFFSRLPTPIPPSFIIVFLFCFFFFIIYAVGFPPFFQCHLTVAGAGAVFFWWVGLMARSQVGWALGCSGCLGLGSAVPVPLFPGYPTFICDKGINHTLMAQSF